MLVGWTCALVSWGSGFATAQQPAANHAPTRITTAAQADAVTRAEVAGRVETTPATRGLLVGRDPANRRRVLAGDAGGGAVRSLYESRLDVVREVSIAKDEVYVAVLEADAGRVEDGEYAELPYNRLVILDQRGRRMCGPQLEGDDVHRYVFAPDGRRIAYLTGVYYEGAEGFFPTGGYVLDIDCCRSATRAQECKRAISEQATELGWVEGDREGVYLHTFEAASPVRRFDARTGSVRWTDLMTTNLSPDARYQLLDAKTAIGTRQCRPTREDRCARVLRAKDNVEVEIPTELKQSRRTSWVGTGAPLLIVSDRHDHDVRTAIVDVDQRAVVERIDGDVLQSRATRTWASGPERVMAPERAIRMQLNAPIPNDAMRQLQIRQVTPDEPQPRREVE